MGCGCNSTSTEFLPYIIFIDFTVPNQILKYTYCLLNLKENNFYLKPISLELFQKFLKIIVFNKPKYIFFNHNNC